MSCTFWNIRRRLTAQKKAEEREKTAAVTFNWFWSKVLKAVTELQAGLNTVEKDAANSALRIEDSLGMTKSKNLLKNTVGTTTQNGITFTYNSDGSVTCNGTATADTNYRYIITLPEGYRPSKMAVTGVATAAQNGNVYSMQISTDGIVSVLSPNETALPDHQTYLIHACFLIG